MFRDHQYLPLLRSMSLQTTTHIFIPLHIITMASSSSSASPPPPSPEFLFLVYLVLGAGASFLFGREPGTLPEDIVMELCPSIVVICFFLASYSVYDVLGCGIAKGKAGFNAADYNDLPAFPPPEELFLAERAQMNQL